MNRYEWMIVTCALCSLAVAPAFGQVTTGSSPRNPAATNQQVAPNGARPDSATGSTSLPGTAAPGTPTDDKATTMGRQDSKATSPGMTGSDSKASGMTDSQATRPSMGRSGMSGHQQNASTEQVRQIQETLKAQGQDPGPIDGVMGARTQAALRSYQGSNNLAATGRADAQTMEKLGVR